MNFTRFLIVLSAVCVINHQPPANAQMAGARAGAGTRAAAPKRINFNEAQRMLGNETEGNLGNQPNRFSRTRLSTGQVLEIYYPISARSSGKKSRSIAVPGYGLLYESELAMKESARPHHVLEELIPDGREFVTNIPELITRLEKRLGGARLNYSSASIKRLDAWIRGYHGSHTTAQTDPRLFQELSAYYGEVLRREINGQWKVHEEKVSAGHFQLEPNIAAVINGRPREIKPWSSVLTALYDEDKRGTKLSDYFLSDSGLK